MEERNKRIVMAYELLDAKDRRFVYMPEIESVYDTHFYNFDEDTKLLKLANGYMGTISDCYILYACAHLGYATVETIMLFLKALKNQAPDLLVPDVNDVEGYHERIRFLFRSGLLYRKLIHYAAIDSDREDVTFYSITSFSYNLLRQHLQKALCTNNLISQKPLQESLGWLCAGYVGVKIACKSHFKEYSDRILRTKQIGGVFMPCEFVCEADHVRYYLSIIPSYLYYDKRYMTETDFNEIKAGKLNFIKNYLSCRTKKGQAICVVACQDKSDMLEIMELLQQVDAMHGFLESIYFTGEGSVRNLKEIRDAFVQMELTDNGFQIVQNGVAFLDE